MKIAVLGAGAMGSLFGARLILASLDVALIDIDARHIDAVRRDGLRFDSDEGTVTVHAPIGSAEAFQARMNLLIVFTKGPHTTAALQSVAHLIGPETFLLTLQNGLGNGERLAQAAPADRVLIGMTNWPADMRAPGWVSSHGSGEVRLWTLDGATSPGLQAVFDALSRAGLNCRLDPQVGVAIWEKAAFNAAMNAIAAITGFTVGQMADHPDLRALAQDVVDEAAATASALGLDVSKPRIVEAVEHAFAGHRAHKPSMLQDVLAGRRTEIDSINGAIVEAAARVGIATPVIQTLARLVRAGRRRAPCDPESPMTNRSSQGVG